MSLPEKDFAERSRSIFEQLRAQTEPADEHPSEDRAEAEPDGDGPPEQPEDAAAAPPEDDSPAELPSDADAENPVPADADAHGAVDAGAIVDLTDGAVDDLDPLAGIEDSWRSHEPIVDLDAGRDPDIAAAPVELHDLDHTPDAADTEEPPSDGPTDAEGSIAAAPIVDVAVEDAVASGVLAEVLAPADVEQVVAPPASAPLPDPQRFVRPLPRVLAIANQKGGVGKTTTTVNLGASLAVLGYRVLVIDLDPQGNATTGLGINSRNLETSIYDVILHDTPLDDCVEPTTLRNLFVAPATIDLAGAEIELVPAFSREQRLKRALEEVKDDYEFVLIDCPPSLGLLTVNALSAASEVVVPIQCEYYALEGLGQLLRNINLVQSNLNPTLELSAIILTMYDARTKLAEQVADEVRQHFGDRVCRNVVPRTVRLSEAPSFGQPIIVFDPSSRGALAYRELATEVSGGPPQRTG